MPPDFFSEDALVDVRQQMSREVHAKAADLGVAVREADYDRLETLDQPLAGVGTLLLISSRETDTGHR
jgi:uncharacterized protein YbjT (DUF2867 family)